MGHVRNIPSDFVKTGKMLSGFENNGARTGILEVVLNLAGRGGFVDRHHDGPGEPQAKVDQRPFVGGLTHEADFVARVNTRGHKTFGQSCYLVIKLLGGEVFPTAIGGRKREKDTVRIFCYPIDQ